MLKTQIAARIALSLLVPLVASFAARAQSVTLIDTFGSGNTFTSAGSVSGTASIVNAVRFAVPAGGDVSVVRIDMALAISGSVASVRIGIFNDLMGLPVGMPIVSAAVGAPLTTTLAFNSAAFVPTDQLTAGRNYWVAPYMTGSGSLFWGSGLMGSTTAASFNGASWSAQTTPNPLSIRVLVAPIASPCCNARGTGGCLLLIPADCATIGGVTIATASTCAVANCSINVTGACCHGTTCTVTTSLGCATSPPGNFLGAGVACTPQAAGGPNPCCPADFNNSGVKDVNDIFAFLALWFGACP